MTDTICTCDGNDEECAKCGGTGFVVPKNIDDAFEDDFCDNTHSYPFGDYDDNEDDEEIDPDDEIDEDSARSRRFDRYHSGYCDCDDDDLDDDLDQEIDDEDYDL